MIEDLLKKETISTSRIDSKGINKVDCHKIIKSELVEISNEDIARIQELLVKLATIEYENYKNAA